MPKQRERRQFKSIRHAFEVFYDEALVKPGLVDSNEEVKLAAAAVFYSGVSSTLDLISSAGPGLGGLLEQLHIASDLHAALTEYVGDAEPDVTARDPIITLGDEGPVPEVNREESLQG